MKEIPSPLKMKRKVLIPIDPEPVKEEEDDWVLKIDDQRKQERERNATHYMAIHQIRPIEVIDDGKIIMLLYSDKVVIFFHNGREPHILKRERNVYRDMALRRQKKSETSRK